PTSIAVQRRDLAVDEVPVDLARELHQLVLHVDDLIQSRAEQIARSCRLVLLRPHRFSPMRRSNAASRFEETQKTKLQDFRASGLKACTPNLPQQLKNDWCSAV